MPHPRRLTSGVVPTALLLLGCASSDPYGRNVVVPAGSIYEGPAEQLRRLGYVLAHVDTIIGYIEAYRLRGGREGTADHLVVDVYAPATTGPLVVTVVAQTLERVQMLGGREQVTGEPTAPSQTVRRDAEALLRTLGCRQVLLEQAMRVEGIELQVRCQDAETGADTTRGGGHPS
jgi:hypothetical protein